MKKIKFNVIICAVLCMFCIFNFTGCNNKNAKTDSVVIYGVEYRIVKRTTRSGRDNMCHVDGKILKIEAVDNTQYVLLNYITPKMNHENNTIFLRYRYDGNYAIINTKDKFQVIVYAESLPIYEDINKDGIKEEIKTVCQYKIYFTEVKVRLNESA